MRLFNPSSKLHLFFSLKLNNDMEVNADMRNREPHPAIHKHHHHDSFHVIHEQTDFSYTVITNKQKKKEKNCVVAFLLASGEVCRICVV